MELIFFGTGGGRINLIKQVRGTGGFRVNSKSANIHIDPGPGALLRSIEQKQDLLGLDAIIVTHNHIDHASDAAVFMEGMSGYGLKKKGVLIGSQAALVGGNGRWDKAIGSHHQSLAKEVYVARPGERKTFSTGHGSFEFMAIQLRHDEPTAFGFKLELDGKIFGHITDTEYLPNLGKEFAGCDCLVINCLKPKANAYHGHLTTDDVVAIVKEAQPRMCILTHFGMEMLRAGPAEEATKIEKATGVKTTAARDGMKIKV